MMQMPVENNGWRIDGAEFFVVRDGLQPLIGRDLLEALGISVAQSLNSVEHSMINKIATLCPLINFHNLFHALVDLKHTLYNLNSTKFFNQI